MNEKLEKLNRQKTAAEKKLIAAQHREKQLEHERKRLTRSKRTHQLCTRAGMLKKFLRDWISNILKTKQDLLAEKKPEAASPDLINLMRDYLNLRKAERRDWSRYGQQKGATKDLQSFVNATNYLKDHEIFTLEQLDSVLEEVKQKYGSISTDITKCFQRDISRLKKFSF